MASYIDKKLIEAGLKVTDAKLCEEDKIWSRYSDDKVNIGDELAKVIRTLSKALPLSKKIKALSVGSGDEPQLRILETACCGGLYLLDLEKEALDIVEERLRRQNIGHVTTILCDYNKVFLNPKKTELFLKANLGREKIGLITLHHSLYYCKEDAWHMLFNNLYRYILAPRGAIHAVLMAAESNDTYSTTWLYNHFVGKFFGMRNNQNLPRFKKDLQRDPLYRKAQILMARSRIRFFVDDFEKFMAVIWMILLYPQVHDYSLKQREEITEFIYKKFWQKKMPLIQMQDHLTIYRGIDFNGLI